MGKKNQQDWGRYFATEFDKEPKDPWEMVGLSLRLVLKTVVFIIAIAIKIIRGLIMGIKGLLRKKKQNQAAQSFAFAPQHTQQMLQQQQARMMQQQYPQQQYPQQQMPMEQYPQQQYPQQQLPQQPMQPASVIERLPTVPPVAGMQMQMLNEVYGAINFIRQELVRVQATVGNINTAINDIYNRLNAIEGVQPVSTGNRNVFSRQSNSVRRNVAAKPKK